MQPFFRGWQRRTALAVGLLASFWGASSAVAGVYLVKDIATQSEGSQPQRFLTTDEYLYFVAYHPVFDIELWRTDGTSSGTRMLRDINPEGPGDADYLVEFGPYVYFVAADKTRLISGSRQPGQEIWRTDGTSAGTEKVIDFADMASVGFPSELTVLGNHIYFASDAYQLGDELWRTDGTEAGTEMVKDISSVGFGSLPEQLTVASDTLFFTADDGVNGRELWASKGTEETTFLVEDITPGDSSDIFEITRYGDDVLFWVRTDRTLWELWRSDGSAVGTAAIHSMTVTGSGQRPGAPFVHNGVIYFSGYDSTYEWELWRSSGTIGSATRLTTSNPNVNIGPHSFEAGPGGIYFIMYDSEEIPRLHVTNGSAETTMLVNSPLISEQRVEPPLVALNGKLLFWVRELFGEPDQIWSVTGPDAMAQPETALLYDQTDRMVVWRDGLYLSSPGPPDDTVRFADENLELWRTDASDEGTYQIRDINFETIESVPQWFNRVQDKTVFYAYTGMFGSELWTTDGTRSGTKLMTDLTPGTAATDMRGLQPFGDGLIFARDNEDGTHSLWFTDGTAAGTAPLGGESALPSFSIIGGLTSNGTQAFFEGRLAGSDTGFWVTDGTTAGTGELLSGAPDYSAARTGRAFPTLLGTTFFVREIDSGIRELWKTDGTPEGTLLVESYGADEFLARDLYVAAGHLFFVADTLEHGKALYSSNGAPGAATMVLSLEPAVGYANFVAQDVVTLDGFAYFRVAETVAGDVLYRSDGTTEGTSVVGSFGEQSGFARFDLVVHEGYVYFSAISDSTGYEIWRANESGVEAVTGTSPATAALRPGALAFLDGRLFYIDGKLAGGPNVSWTELWSIDLAGGEPVFEAAFSKSDRIDELFVHDDQILFSANDGRRGRELWAYSDAFTLPAADPNGDFVTDAVDVQLIINQVLGQFTGYDGDVNGDGEVDASDIQAAINEALAGSSVVAKNAEAPINTLLQRKLGSRSAR